ncbi:hypothetical protein [Nonlabens xiamenensis]|uniref:hypothetical protein n=1 Tax=Nonlabens xiamenensis TaxID=2341043 RepID=UPI000F6150AF|nr:hypothetical protein [Nonlabens xiamenensis]
MIKICFSTIIILFIISCKSINCNEENSIEENIISYKCSYLKRQDEYVIFLNDNLFVFSPKSSKESILNSLKGQGGYDLQIEYISGFLEYIKDKDICFELTEVIEMDLPDYDLVPLPGEENYKYIGNASNRILPENCK